ncbi:MAG: T9SS type A sorting domain-containing protein, partial [Panacibacter sp.]
GKIIISGGINYAEYFIAQHNPDGSIDSSFGGKGSIRYPGDQFSSLALQQDGKIVISYNESEQVGSLVRFKTDGTKDSTFGINGTVTTEISSRNLIYDLLIQPDGKVLAAGGSDKTANKEILVLLKFDSNGTPDTTFGDNGIVYTSSDTAWMNANSVILQPDNQIIIGGYLGNPLSSMYASNISARYNKDGSLNDKYGTNGIQITGQGAIKDIALQADGKIIALSQGPDVSLQLMRLNGEHQTDPQFAKIKKWLHRHGFTWDDFPHLAPGGSIHVERSSNGSIFTTIASIMPRNNNQPTSFEDPAPLAGTNYYRLTATAANGDNISSNVIAIENDNAASVKVYPNPVKDNLQVSGLSATVKTTLTITDLSGNRSAAVAVTGSSYNWNVSQLKPGSYILKMVNGSVVVTKMFVKE